MGAAQSGRPAGSTKKKGATVKHIPQRTCVACRTGRPKRHLVRVVRTIDGGVVVDKTGKQSGRGAYLCPAQECWRLAKTRKSLDHALEITVSTEVWQTLDLYAQGLPEARL